MKTRTFTASISQEGELFVAQCLEIDVASQGKSEDEAVENLKEALELYFGAAVSDRDTKASQI